MSACSPATNALSWSGVFQIINSDVLPSLLKVPSSIILIIGKETGANGTAKIMLSSIMSFGHPTQSVLRLANPYVLAKYSYIFGLDLN